MLIAVVACGAKPPVPNPAAPAVPAEGPKKMEFRADGLPPPRASKLEVTGVELPAIASAGTVPLEDGTAVVITTHGIAVEGKVLIAVANGAVDPADKEGGAMGILIPKLRDFTKALAQAELAKGASLGRINIVADKTTPYQLLMEVMFSTKQAGLRDYAILARVNGEPAALPLTLPDKGKGRIVPTGAPRALGMIVSVTAKQAIVWSFSEQEGTLQNPKKTIPISPTAATEVGDTLAAIAKVRSPKGIDSQIVLQADQRVPLDTLAGILGAMRVSFPDVVLSSGFE